MRVRPLISLLSSVLMAVLPSQGNGQTPRQSPLPLAQPLTVASNSEELKRELLRIQMEMSQTARDMDAIDARMMQGIANKDLGGTSRIMPKVHELLKDHNTGTTIKVFLDSPRSDLKWESCLKTGKLYMGLLEKIFAMSKERRPGDEKTLTASSVADQSPEAVQLVFLARMMTGLTWTS